MTGMDLCAGEKCRLVALGIRARGRESGNRRDDWQAIIYRVLCSKWSVTQILAGREPERRLDLAQAFMFDETWPRLVEVSEGRLEMRPWFAK